MELRPTIEAVVKDTIAIGKFIGEHAVHGAWGTLANIVHQPQTDEVNIIKGEE